MNKKLRKIINHYGINKQLKYFQSEVFELTEAIIDYKYVECYKNSPAEIYGKEHIAEEIADTMVMLSQFKEYYDITDKEIQKIMEFKVNRQIDRMEHEI